MFTVKEKQEITATFEKDEILEQTDIKARNTCFSMLLKRYFQYYLILYL